MRISDPRVQDILDTNACAALPKAVVGPAYRLIRLLLNCRCWADVATFTAVAPWADGRYIAPVCGKWGLSFEWTGSSAWRLALERV